MIFRIKLICFFIALILTGTLNSAEAQVRVSDGDDLQVAVNAAQPGDVIIVENGTYNDFESTFEVAGSLDNPIHIKAETIGGVILTGESHFVFKKAAHIILEGFVFDATGDDTLIKMEGSNHIRITRNVFELTTTESVKWVYIGGFWNDYNFEFMSHNNRIDHNVIQNKTTPGHYITIDGTNNEDRSEFRQSQYDRIDHNHFKNNSPRAANEQESIRIGWSEMSMSSGFTIVEHNLFEDCDGDPEIISVKSSDNIIRHNTFKRSYGTLSLRHGNRNWVEGNFFFGDGKPTGMYETSEINTGGIRIYGTDHVIINNYMEGLMGTRWDAPIALTQGDAIDGESSSLSKHFRAERVTIANNTLVNNTHGIEIGFDNSGKYGKGLKDITIANNIVTGTENVMITYMDGNDQGEEITWINNVFYPKGDAELVSGGSAFSSDQAVEADPKLVYSDSLWRATSETHAFDNTFSGLSIATDIEGQSRSTLSMVGADHYSTDSVLFRPLKAEDVGPFAESNETNSESLFTSFISDFEAEGGTQTIELSANFEWTITNETEWVSVNNTSGSGNADIEITAMQNPSLQPRSAIITISGETLTRNITINQLGASTIAGTVKVDVVEVTASSEQAPENVKENLIDGDLGTRWSAEGDGEFAILDLGESYDVKLLKIAIHKGDERYVYFDIETSENGTDYTVALKDTSNSKTTEDLENYEIDVTARYVKVIGYGNSGGSKWTSINEVEVYAVDTTATSAEQKNGLPSSYKLLGNYPNPFNPGTNIQFEVPKTTNYTLTVYSIHGQKVFVKQGVVQAGNSNVYVDLSQKPSGMYVYKLTAEVNGTSSLIGTGRMTLIK